MVKHFRDLDVYQGTMSLVMEIFALWKEFPPDSDRGTFETLDDACDKIISQIVKMIDQADRWIIKPMPSKRRLAR